MLELINVKKIYTTKAGDTAALNGLTVTFPSTGLVFVTGKSGSGKTTLLNVVGGLDGIDGGDIVIQGKKFSEFTSEEYNSYRNTYVGFVFQEYNLLSEYTVEKNIRIATELQGVDVKTEEINALLEEVDLAGLNNRLPSQLSGGQKQRVAIARALIKNPKIIMADEPTGALDSVTGIQVLETLKKLSKERLVLVVSHDLELAEKYADRIIRLVDGELVEDVILSDKEIIGNVAENDKDFIVKSGAELTKEETKSLVSAIKDKKNIVISENISIRKKTKTDIKAEEYSGEKVTFVSSKMKYRSSAELGLKSLKVKPLRLAFTILLSVVAFAVFGLFDTIASYSNSKVVANLMSSGDLNAIQLSAEHVGETATTKFNLSNAEINRIKRESGLNFRPIYNINDKNYSGINNAVRIDELIGVIKTTVGKEYYPSSLSGFIEFAPEEITADGVIDKDGFNFKVVCGEYPSLKYAEGGGLIEDSVYEIAISTLIADSLIHWTSGSDLGGNKIYTYEDFFIQPTFIKLNSISYKIVGIIDCGKIPQKYSQLAVESKKPENRLLIDEYNAYINAGCYLFGFMPYGFVDLIQERNNRIVSYYTNEYSYHIYNSRNAFLSSISDIEDTRYYKASDIPNENVFLFNQSLFDSEGNRITIPNKNILKEDEVLINVENFRKLYAEEIEIINDDVSRESDFARAIGIATNPKRSLEDKEEAIQEVSEIFDQAGLPVVKYINIIRETKGTRVPTSHLLKVVGVYTGVCTDIGPAISSWYPYALSTDGLKKLGVYTEQGIYSRVIAPNAVQTTSCNFKDGASFIAELLTRESGYRLQLHGNAIVKSIDDNGKLITDFTGLVFIIAIVLALFSIFMLFNYIATSIVSKRQSIGVLRALGSNGKDVFSMFITESLVISLINGVLASLVAYVGCYFVNYYIKNVMTIAVNFAIFGARQIIIIILASIFTGIISSLLPIIRICKEKPVELIRKP